MYPKFHAVLKLSVNTANIFRRLPSLDRAALVIFSLHKMVKEHIRFYTATPFHFQLNKICLRMSRILNYQKSVRDDDKYI